MLPNHPNKARGFTLPEVIAAMTVLAIAMPPLLWSLRQSQAQGVNPVLIARARWLAVEKMEDVLADRHSTKRGYAFVVTGNYPVERKVTGFPQYGRSVSVSETAADLASPGKGFKRVTVRVTWRDVDAKLQWLEVPTIITEYTP